MIQWFTENALTVIVTAVLLAATGAAVFSLVREKTKKKKSGCCTGNCATCGMNCSYGNKQK